MNLQESIRRILREDHQFVRKHISDTNPHTGARNAFMGIPSLSGYDWDLIPKLIYPDDKKINKEMLYPASKRDVKRYMKQYIQGSEFPAIVLIDNGKEYSIADGQHRLSAALKLGVPIYAYVGTEKPKLQESIRRILREETNDYLGFNDLSENDLYNISEWGLNGEYYYSSCNDYDNPIECGVRDFKEFLTTPWPLELGNVPNNPIIYRIVKLKNLEDLNRINLGYSWFSNPKQYEKDCFFDMLDHIKPNRFNGSIYILEGKTNINNIDVPRTLWERSTQWCENEIVIINDSEIELLSVKKLN